MNFFDTVIHINFVRKNFMLEITILIFHQHQTHTRIIYSLYKFVQINYFRVKNICHLVQNENLIFNEKFVNYGTSLHIQLTNNHDYAFNLIIIIIIVIMLHDVIYQHAVADLCRL